MFFIGIFSSPLPYLAIFSIYLIGMINYSFHAKGNDAETYTGDYTVKLEKDKKAPYATALGGETTYFFDHYYPDQTHDQAVHLGQIPEKERIFQNGAHAVHDPHCPSSVFLSSLFIRPPPHLL